MEEFKAPSMPPPVFAKPKEREAKLVENSEHEEAQQQSEQPFENTEVEVQPEVQSKPPSASNKTPASHYGPSDQEKYQKILASLKYVAPSGSCSPGTKLYSLEVLKDGSILENIKLQGKGYFIVGRVPGCDIVAENPTISRMHAIFQYIGEESENPSSGNASSEEKLVPGFYLYDLGSTHGTFVNKNQVYPKRYYRLHVGHVIKFGNSTRLYILSGPPEDEEEENEKTVSELVKEKNEKEMERRRLKLEGVEVEEPLVKNVDEDGVSWGMPEDAVEESDNRENPFAMDLESTELSLDNPKRTLRGWFEREGYDLEYDVKEKAAGHFICRINLPLDGPDHQNVFAEVELKGKKKDVVAQCALQACQILDKYGVLRQSNHESRLKRKQRDWADEDYYSSDDDNYLDRTGTIEKKREKRMRQAGLIKQETETYESLLAKDKDFQKEIDGLGVKIRQAEKNQEEDEGAVDPLDAFMMDLKTGVSDVKKLKAKLRELTDQQNKNRKLLKIAMPTIVFPTNKGEVEQPSARDKAFESASEDKLVSAPPKPSLKGMSGPRIQFKSFNIPHPSTQDGDTEDTIESNETLSKCEPPTPTILDVPPPSSTEPVKRPHSEPQNRTLGPQIPPSMPGTSGVLPDSSEEPSVADTQDINGDTEEDSSTAPELGKAKRTRYRKPNSKPEAEEYDMEDPDYVTWVPPTGQRGDGRTSLNEKLGY